MANMSYCRFENTLKDLEEVYDHIDDVLSQSEHEAREEIIKICRAIAMEYKNYDLLCEDDEEELDEEEEDLDEEDE